MVERWIADWGCGAWVRRVVVMGWCCRGALVTGLSRARHCVQGKEWI